MNPGPVTTPLAPQPAQPPEIDELPLPYLEIDTQGKVTRVNRATLDLHHPAGGDLVGKLVWDLVAFDERDFSRAAFQAQIEAGGDPPPITRNIFDRTGSFRTYRLYRSLICDAEGKPAGMRMVGVDVTEMTEAVDRARRACQWLESAMASMSDAVILADTLGVVRSVNPAAAKLTGLDPAELLGMTIEDVLPVPGGQSTPQTALDHRTALERHHEANATIVNRAGEHVHIHIGAGPIIDIDNGSVCGVAAVLRKIGSAGCSG